MGLLIEVPGDLIGFKNIDEGVGIDLPHLPRDFFNLVPRDDRVDHGPGLAAPQTGPLEQGGAMMGRVLDLFVDFLRFVRDNEQGGALVARVEQMDDLGGGVLEEDGIQALSQPKRNPATTSMAALPNRI